VALAKSCELPEVCATGLPVPEAGTGPDGQLKLKGHSDKVRQWQPEQELKLDRFRNRARTHEEAA
jgi:hypothetical protein